ncbi:hypothetical protein D1AOALGA4SA_11458 [Olavius algarvensis Delta 1 endosymbiont]|nr:hypothetical protein D1AOALGA4SA_11458 [Olavius algarvensis Delta 1 endosymbiont]
MMDSLRSDLFYKIDRFGYSYILHSLIHRFPLEWTHKRKNSHYISMIR